MNYDVENFLGSKNFERKEFTKNTKCFTREILKLFLKSLISKREQLTSTHLEFACFMSKNEVQLLGGLEIYSSTLFTQQF